MTKFRGGLGRGVAAAGAAALASLAMGVLPAAGAVRLDRVTATHVSKDPLTRIAAGDVDGDGRGDVAVSGPRGLTLLYGDPDVVFADAQKLIPADRQPLAMAIGDLNGDGLGDLAVTASGMPGNQLCRPCTVIRYGSGRFRGQRALKVFDEEAADLAIAPFDADPVPDLIATLQGGGATLRLAHGGPLRPTVSDVSVSDGRAHLLRRMAVGDLDGDGRADDLVIADAGTRSLHVVLNLSVLGRDIYVRTPEPDCCPRGYEMGLMRLAIGDVNGDNRQDIVFSNATRTARGTGVMLGGGLGTFAPPQTLDPTGHGAAVIAVADLDGDGAAEIVTGQVDGTLTVRRYAAPADASGAATFPPAGFNAELDLGPRITALALVDVDGDGRPEIAATDQKGRVDVVHVTPELPATPTFGIDVPAP